MRILAFFSIIIVVGVNIYFEIYPPLTPNSESYKLAFWASLVHISILILVRGLLFESDYKSDELVLITFDWLLLWAIIQMVQSIVGVGILHWGVICTSSLIITYLTHKILKLCH